MPATPPGCTTRRSSRAARGGSARCSNTAWLKPASKRVGIDRIDLSCRSHTSGDADRDCTGAAAAVEHAHAPGHSYEQKNAPCDASVLRAMKLVTKGESPGVYFSITATTACVAEESLVPAIPEHHPLTKERRVRLSKLRSEPFVEFTRSLSPGLYDVLLAACRRAKIAPASFRKLETPLAGVHGSSEPERRSIPPIRDPMPIVQTLVVCRKERVYPAMQRLIEIAAEAADKIRYYALNSPERAPIFR
jgi:hypothetical protein